MLFVIQLVLWLGSCNTERNTTTKVRAMGTRSVRLDDEAEKALEDIVDRTGMSITDAIKSGLITFREVSLKTANRRPSDFFNEFDLGPGGYIQGAARDSKSLLRKKFRDNRNSK